MIPRDREILGTLTHKVGVLSLGQIARTWWSSSLASTAVKRMEGLQRAGLVVGVRFNVHPELELKEPLLTWSPGDVTPHFGFLAHRLQRRWNEPCRPTLVYRATTLANQRFGGSGGSPIRSVHQVTHDLHVAALYLRWRTERPERASRWISEQRLASSRRGQVLPDALIKGSDGKPETIIEFGGSYRAPVLARKHAAFAEMNLSYELW